MNNIKVFPLKKNTASHTAALTNEEIHKIELKLEDTTYIDGAIYRLATIITDRLLDGGFEYD